MARTLIRLAFIVACVLCELSAAHAYVGPGAGFVFLSSFLVVTLAVLLALLCILLGFLRLLLRPLRRRAVSDRPRRRVVILGFDGMDPRLAQRLMEAGTLPNLSRLASEGTFARLRTTCPALSPVAWSSFATGVDPSRHGIFDFVARDPGSYQPVLSSVRTRPGRRRLRLGRAVLPLSKPTIELQRKSRSWWTLLGEQGVFCSVLRVPLTYPPEKLSGVMLAGMCVPDLLGTQGTFAVYTTRGGDGRTYQDGVCVYLRRNGSDLLAEIAGPTDPFSLDGDRLHIPLKVCADRAKGRVTMKVQGQTVTLREREWSDWVRLEFSRPLRPRIRGICQFYLAELSDEVTLYQSPIHVDPECPAVPLSHPAYYAPYLAKQLGPFGTLGLAEDTSALDERVLTPEAFVAQSYRLHDERERIFLDALANTRDGVCAAVFDTTDRVQHMFWRSLSAGSPDHPILEAYRRMDELVGRVMDELGPDDVLMVMSDHGFCPFERGINVNTWLLQHGYLALKHDADSGEWFEGVDWDRTRAYAMGLAGLYLNLRGREPKGIVEPGEEAAELHCEIADGLSAVLDPKTGRSPFRRVLDAHELYGGPYLDRAPELLLGYADGYRTSWDSAKGKAGDSVFEDNDRHWSGDHCVDPELVPGVLFCNRELEAEDPSILDIGPTVLGLFGVSVPAHMQGRDLFAEGPSARTRAAAREKTGEVAART